MNSSIDTLSAFSPRESHTKPLNLRSQLRAFIEQRNRQYKQYLLTGEPESGPFPEPVCQSIRSSMDFLKSSGLVEQVRQVVDRNRFYQYHEIAQLARELSRLSIVPRWSVQFLRGKEGQGLIITGQYRAATPALLLS